MKIVIEEIGQDQDQVIILRTHQIDAFARDLFTFIENHDKKILGQMGKEIHLLDPDMIYYIESVDRKTFIYVQDQIYTSQAPLYQLEEELNPKHFFRASKSMILNMNFIVSVRPILDSRYEARLRNNEKVYISRNYVSELKKRLGL